MTKLWAAHNCASSLCCDLDLQGSDSIVHIATYAHTKFYAPNFNSF